MRLLASNFSPSSLPSGTFVDHWSQSFNLNDTINIAVGYASNDSLLYLKRLIEQNSPKNINLCIGMANIEGMFQSQYAAAIELDKYLRGNNLGGVVVCTAFPFHGKVQTFSNDGKLNCAFVGSSNLSNIVPPSSTFARGNYEIDAYFDEESVVPELDTFILDLIRNSSTSISDLSNLKVRPNPNNLMTSIFDVEEVPESELKSIWASALNEVFEIPIKSAPQSNLNAYFGEGRKNKQGFSKPRHWYEVEIIVDLDVQRSAKNYPANQEFIVYTDDGYKFILKTSGDYGKNLRSKYDLTILGRWLKGRMEDANALTSGTSVTGEVLEKYGRSTVSLIPTKLKEIDHATGELLDVWILDFGIK